MFLNDYGDRKCLSGEEAKCCVAAKHRRSLVGGWGAVITATGMAAVDPAFRQLCPRDLLIAPHDRYSGAHRLLRARERKGCFEVAFLDQSDSAALAADPIGALDGVAIP